MSDENGTPEADGIVTPPASSGTPPAADNPADKGAAPAKLPTDGPGSLITGQPPKPEDKPADPSGYVFSFQPDTVVDEGLMGEFRQYAHKKGMSNAEAGELAQFYEYAARKSVADAHTALVQQEQQWKQQCSVDPEIGGPKMEESIAHATLAVEEFSTPELMHVLHTTGYGSHPAVVKFFVNVGKKIAGKPMVKGEAPSGDKSLAELMYPSMATNN